MGLIAAFIAIAITLGIAIQILGNAATLNCSKLTGANATFPSNSTVGWAKACDTAQTSTQNATGLLIVLLIVIAAVAILFVVRML